MRRVCKNWWYNLLYVVEGIIVNNIILRNAIVRNIQSSHKVNDIEFDQADLLVKRNNQVKEDVITVKFKKFSNIYKDGDIIDIVGNVRSYTKKLPSGKNSVQIYVFTYFDKPNDTDDFTNDVKLDGRICMIEPLKVLNNNKQLLHFTIANNIIVDNVKINSYVPCIAWGELAKQLSQMPIGIKISVQGELHSREYKKQTVDDIEIKVAHELFIKKYVITPWVKDND